MEISKVNEFLKACNELENKPISIKTAYKLAKLRSALQAEADFYTTKLQNIVNKYAEVDEKGNYTFMDDGAAVKIKDGMLDECRKETEELAKFDIVVPNIRFTINEFDNLNLTLSQVEALLDFIEE